MPKYKLNELTNEQRTEIANFLLKNSEKGKLKHGLIKAAVLEFGRHRATISRIWKKVKLQLDKGSSLFDVRSKKYKRGRKKLDRSQVQQRIKGVRWNKRQNIRALSSATGTSVSTLSRMLKEGSFQRSSTFLKPKLNQQAKLNRLRFCHSKVHPNTREFHHMFDSVHVDEKWFYLKKDKQK